MKYKGCPAGYIHHGSACKKIEIPYVGHGGVPSVENRSGCRAVGGSWMDDYGGVCIMNEFRDKAGYSGYTAPIKGVVVGWDYLDFYEAEDRTNPSDKGVCYANVFANLVERFDPEKKEYYTAGVDPVCEMNVNEFYDVDDCLDLQILAKNIALSLSKTIKEGKAKDILLRYVTPHGLPTTHRARDAVVTSGLEIEDISELYKPRKHFSFKGSSK